MACGEGSAVIACPPRAVLELVLDVERYRLADRKIGRVHWVHRHGNHGQVKHDGRLLGLPFPPIVLAFTLTPWSRLDFGIVTAPWPLTGFEGSFTCEPTAQGTPSGPSGVLHRPPARAPARPRVRGLAGPRHATGGQAHQATPRARTPPGAVT